MVNISENELSSVTFFIYIELAHKTFLLSQLQLALLYKDYLIMSEKLCIDLNGEWDIKQVSGDISIKGRIPGVVPFKKLELKKPDIQYSLTEKDDQLVIDLKSDTLTPFVWLRHGNIHGTWSDNGMLLLPGETLKLIFKPRNTPPTLAEMEQVIMIHNLHDAGFTEDLSS